MKNKFEWLEEAKKDIAEFADTDIAKLSERKMRQKESNLYAASCVSKETQSKGGKTSGAQNVESGHWASLKTKEHQSKAGTAGGNANVESGQWAKFIAKSQLPEVRAKAKKTYSDNKLKNYKAILSNVNDTFQTKDLMKFCTRKQFYYIKQKGLVEPGDKRGWWIKK